MTSLEEFPRLWPVIMTWPWGTHYTFVSMRWSWQVSVSIHYGLN